MDALQSLQAAINDLSTVIEQRLWQPINTVDTGKIVDLFAGGCRYPECIYDYAIGEWRDTHRYVIYNPSHWMALPKDPE